jgi:DNA-binding transcriptional regulator YiaG
MPNHNHPNRSRAATNAARNPTPDEIRQARASAGLTQTEAAALIYCTLRAWQDWESGARRMHPAFWELWRIKMLGGKTPFRQTYSFLPKQEQS